MEFRTENLPKMHLAAIRYIGPYPGIGDTFTRLAAWAQQSGVDFSRAKFVGVYYDDPESTPADQLRSDACVTIGEEFAGDGEVQPLTLEGGPYAIGAYVGPYDGLGAAWGSFMQWLPANGQTADWSRPCFELYVSDMTTTPPEKLLTELYVPLEAK